MCLVHFRTDECIGTPVVMLQVLVTTFWSQIEWISSSFCTILVQGDISCWFSGFMFIVRLFLQVIQFSNLRLTYCYSISTVLVYDRVEGLRLRLVPHAYVCYLTCHIWDQLTNKACSNIYFVFLWVQAHAASAILNFSENCRPDILTPYLDGIVGKLLLLLQVDLEANLSHWLYIL